MCGYYRCRNAWRLIGLFLNLMSDSDLFFDRRADCFHLAFIACAVAAPANWAKMNPGASVGRIPAKVLLALRASVTAGLANGVDAVNQ